MKTYSPRFFIPAPLFFFDKYISARSILVYIIPLFLSFPAPHLGTITLHPPPQQNTRYGIQTPTCGRDSLVCLYPLPVPVAPRAKPDLTRARYGNTQVPQPTASCTSTRVDIEPG